MDDARHQRVGCLFRWRGARGICGHAPHRFLPVWLAASVGLDLADGTNPPRGVVVQHGFGYNSRVYNSEEPNPDLIAVGSHLNGLIPWESLWPTTAPSAWGWASCTQAMGTSPTKQRHQHSTRQALFASQRRRVAIHGWRGSASIALCRKGIGGRDHGAYGGHVYGVQEHLPSPPTCHPVRVTAQAALVNHGALRADENTDAPSDSVATNPLDRLQPGLSGGWSWLFGRARLDLIKGGVFLHPTPGFIKGYNKAQVFLSVHSALDAFVSLRFTDWRADYVSAGVALALQRECKHLSQVGPLMGNVDCPAASYITETHMNPKPLYDTLILKEEACVVPSRPGSWMPCSCWGPCLSRGCWGGVIP